MSLVSLLRSLLALSAPILISQLLIMSTGVIDLSLTGHYAPSELPAVGIATSIYACIYVSFTGLLRAASPVIGYAVGAKEPHHHIDHLVKQNIWLAAILSAIGLPLLDQIPHWNLLGDGVDEALTTSTYRYLSYLKWALPAALIVRALVLYVYAMGDVRITVVTSACMLLIKIPLSYILLKWMGPTGCAIGTTIASWCSLLVCIEYTRRTRWAISPVFLWVHWPTMKKLIYLGMPIATTEFLEISSYGFMGILVARIGALPSAAHQIIANLGSVLFMLPLAIGIASGNLLSRALGSNDQLQVRAIVKMSLYLSIGLSFINALLLIFFRYGIAGLYTADSSTIGITITLIPILAIYHIFDSIQVVLNSLLRGYQHTFFPTLIYSSVLWGIGVLGGSAVTFGWYIPQYGVVGLWSTMAASLCLISFLLYRYLLHIQNTMSEGS